MLDPKLSLFENLKLKINGLKIGFNKDEKKLIIEALDNSTHVHYHNETGLTDEQILKLPSEKIGDFLKHRAILNLEASSIENSEEVIKLATAYNTTALATGITILSLPSSVLKDSSTKKKSQKQFLNAIPNAVSKNVVTLATGETLCFKDDVDLKRNCSKCGTEIDDTITSCPNPNCEINKVKWIVKEG